MSTAATRIRSQIDLPTGVAAWVFLAHAVALASPIVLTWQAAASGARLRTVLDEPSWLHVSAGFFLIGSVFEIGQNTMDRWYYQGPYPAFADLLFNTFIALGIGALGLAAGVGAWWVIAIVGAASVAFPVLYLTDRTPYPATGVLAIVSVGLLYHRLHDPVVFVLLVFTTGLNLYFLALVVKTKAQSLHGAIALTNGLGLLSIPWALRASQHAHTSARSVIALTLAIAIVAALAWKPLSALKPTPRPLSEREARTG